jgi:hypothetical protein
VRFNGNVLQGVLGRLRKAVEELEVGLLGGSEDIKIAIGRESEVNLYPWDYRFHKST